MRKRSNVDNLCYLDTNRMAATNGSLTAIAWTLDVGLHLTQTKVIGNLCTILSSHLGSIGSVLLGTTETHLACGRPRNHITFAVGNGNDDVVKGRVYMKLTLCCYLDVSLLCRSCFLCHILLII